jgi:cell wall assembly regulator SMI1
MRLRSRTVGSVAQYEKHESIESVLAAPDMDHLESAIGKKLPTPFRNHYLKYNGGVPERTYWVSEEFDEE